MKLTADIKNFGLGKIGYWKLSHHRSTNHLSHMPGIDFVLEDHFKKAKNVVYAFAIDDRVAYVGETTKGMGERFLSYRYGNPLKRDTDNRVKIEITKALEKGRSVTIWASIPNASIIIAGRTLEDSGKQTSRGTHYQRI
jgi:hypothetical protein